MTLSRLVGIMVLGVAVACGGEDSDKSAGSGSGGSAGTTGGTTGSGATGGGVGAEYPPAPYGKEVGDTIDDYQFNGYVNDAGTALSNTLGLSDYSFDAMRKSGARYALVHLSAFYCAGCKSAGRDLGDLSAPVQQAGGLVVEVLFDGPLDPWITTYELKVTTVAPKQGTTLVAGPGDREHAFIVELATMKIVWKAFGSYGTTTNSSAKQGVAEMQALLGS